MHFVRTIHLLNLLKGCLLPNERTVLLLILIIVIISMFCFSAMALATLLLHAVNANDSRLQSIYLKEEVISQSSVIRTRSKSKGQYWLAAILTSLSMYMKRKHARCEISWRLKSQKKEKLGIEIF